MRKKLIFLLLCLLLLLFIVSCGQNTSYKTLEDEVFARSLELQNTYGKIAADMVTAYCDGEKQYMIIYYYGIGKNSQNIGDTYCIYEINKDGEVIISDPNGDYDDLSEQLMHVVLVLHEVEWEDYKSKNMEITYEQYKNFEEGYLPTYFPPHDMLHEGN